MNILIIDDDKSFMKTLQEDISICINCSEKISFELKDSDFLNIQFKTLDFAFIDIDLVTADGIDIAKVINKKFPLAKVIFVSIHEDLVFKSFGASVYHFIRKSNYEIDKRTVFDQMNGHISNNLKFKYINTTSRRKEIVRPEKIKYILALGRELAIFEDQEFNVIGSIKSILEKLECPMLVQVQRGLVVNLNFISDIQNSKLYTKNNQCYSIGRKYYDELINKYEEYLLK